MFRKIKIFFKKCLLVVTSLKKVYRYGGFVPANISMTSVGERLQNKRVLITGGSSGIGLSIASKCLSEGAMVVITGRTPEKLASALSSLNDDNLKALAWDVSDLATLKEKFEQAKQLVGGQFDILFNNAAILGSGAFPRVEEKTWDDVYRTNSKALFFLTQHVCREWIDVVAEEKTRKVINISSQGGFVGATYPYRMTKWDVAGLTQGLGIQLAPYGILVNGIAPGIIATDMQKDCLRQKDNLFYPDNPVRRFALPEEIAELALFLASDTSNFIVGQTIVCDGGYSIK